MNSIRGGVGVYQRNDDGDHLTKVDGQKDETEEEGENKSGLLECPRVEGRVLERSDDAENQETGGERNAKEC